MKLLTIVIYFASEENPTNFLIHLKRATMVSATTSLTMQPPQPEEWEEPRNAEVNEEVESLCTRSYINKIVQLIS